MTPRGVRCPGCAGTHSCSPQEASKAFVPECGNDVGAQGIGHEGRWPLGAL